MNTARHQIKHEKSKRERERQYLPLTRLNTVLDVEIYRSAVYAGRRIVEVFKYYLNAGTCLEER
jgi:hypothetical protein